MVQNEKEKMMKDWRTRKKNKERKSGGLEGKGKNERKTGGVVKKERMKE